jgi:hypothetical protein
MMRKVGTDGPPRLYPATIGRPPTSTLRAKRPQCGRLPTGPATAAFARLVHNRLRHSRAPLREAALQKSRGKRLILEQSARSSGLSIKRASTPSNFRKVFALLLATFGMGHALVTHAMPWGEQKTACPKNRPAVISFSALSISGWRADMEHLSNHKPTSRAHHGGLASRPEEISQ